MILIILLALAAVLLTLTLVFRKKIKEAAINKPLFILGISISFLGAFLRWQGSILGGNTTGIATVIGIIGIGFISTSGIYHKTSNQ